MRACRVNRPIIRLYGLVALLFALLVGVHLALDVFEASSLRENPLNAPQLLEQQRIDRGPILAANGDRAGAQRARPRRHYQRTYPTGVAVRARRRLLLHRPDLGSTGLEQLPQLRTRPGSTGTNLQSILDQLQGKKPQGEKVVTTLDPAAQRVAERRSADTTARSWRSNRAPARSR